MLRNVILSFVANAEATSVDESQECDTLPEPVCRELSDGTKVNYVFIVRILTCLCVMMDFDQGFPPRDPLTVSKSTSHPKTMI